MEHKIGISYTQKSRILYFTRKKRIMLFTSFTKNFTNRANLCQFLFKLKLLFMIVYSFSFNRNAYKRQDSLFIVVYQLIVKLD